jgi:hypothetical protein
MREVRLNRRKTTEEVVKKAIKVHNGFYDYSKTTYVVSSIKVIITCPIHGDFSQLMSAHLKGTGCLECGIDKSIKYAKDYIHKANKIHNNFYTYTFNDKTKVADKMSIWCPLHGEFLQSFNEHVNAKQRCPLCAQAKRIASLTKQSHIPIDEIRTTVYTIKVESEQETFYKIGVTCNMGRRIKELRRHYKNCIVVNSFETNLSDALVFERYFLKDNSEKRFYPTISHVGYTECLTIDPIEQANYEEEQANLISNN